MVFVPTVASTVVAAVPGALLNGDEDGLDSREERRVQTFALSDVVVGERDLGHLARDEAGREREAGCDAKALGEESRVSGRAGLEVEAVGKECDDLARGEWRLIFLVSG